MIIHIYDDDLLNGEGIREVIFLQGCPHCCKGCFNPETWKHIPDTRESIEQDYIYYKHLYKKLSLDYISGITITGGDPFYEKNIKQLEDLINLAKSKNKTIWVYTGYTYEYLLKTYPNILNNINVLCDGKFIEELKSPEKPWVGSSNQRVIDIQKSLNQNNIVLYDN